MVKYMQIAPWAGGAVGAVKIPAKGPAPHSRWGMFSCCQIVVVVVVVMLVVVVVVMVSYRSSAAAACGLTR